MKELTNAFRKLVGNPEEKKLLAMTQAQMGG
jgi:hypothetical protein